MPRFYFDLTADDHTVEDQVGSDIHNVERAKSEAISTLLEASRFSPSDGQDHRFRVTVRDDAKHLIFEASNAMMHRWLK